MRDGAIVYEDLESAAELPIGWTDSQDAGHATGSSAATTRRASATRSARTRGSSSCSRRASGSGARGAATDGFEVEEEPLEDPPLALIGVRACELHGIAIQDRVFLGGSYADRDYAARRKDAFVVAVNCFEPAGTCFCVSMGTGPKAEAGYDLALTEILDGEHRLLVEVGSERGAEVLSRAAAPAGASRRTSTRPAPRSRARPSGWAARSTPPTSATCSRATSSTSAGTTSPTRCLTCGNCTLVCPTCFCTTVEDVTDLTGDHAERTRSGTRASRSTTPTSTAAASGPSGRSRYRQWLTHKFGTWHDQFGSSGCVGCGRCITWCPVGIDVTEELTAIRASEGADDGDD